MNTSTRFLVTTALPDRVGILRDVTGALFARGANFTDLRQTVIGGVFTLSAIAEFEAPADPDSLVAAVRAALPERDACVDVRPCAPVARRASDGTGRSALSITRLSSGAAPAGERYVASVMGPDRPGRIHEIARIFADAGVNVEDWRHDFSDPERTLTIGIVTVPPSCDVPALQRTLAEALGPTGLATSLRHENIFRATNEVGPIRTLLGDGFAVPRNSTPAPPA